MSSESTFFPPNTLPDEYADWYRRFLRGLKEPRLHDSDATAYRFLWLRTFHPPIAVRAVHDGESPKLIVKQSDGQGGYATGRVTTNEKRPLTIEEWSRVTAVVDTVRFWTLETGGEECGLDGAQWVVEGVRNGEYHLVHRWSDEAEGTVGELCFLLLTLSGLKITEVY